MQAAASRTQSRLDALIALDRVREAARRDRRARFTALLHHVTVERLQEGFFALKHEAAPGVDGITWEQYDSRPRRSAPRSPSADPRGYLPGAAVPSRLHSEGRRTAATAGHRGPGGQDRPTGRGAGAQPDLRGRLPGLLLRIPPRRSQHDALDALWVGLMRKKVNWVLDADIRGFFDNIDHGWLLKFLEHRIADRRILRLIQQWLRAGVSEDGQWTKTEVGTPQGAVASPLLANVFLHYVFDLWVQQWRTKSATGDVIVVRYADDFVVGFQHRREAERFLRELGERFEKFGLALHPEKTRLIEFGRFAAENRRKRGERKPETFTFLGFTHICGRKR